MNSPLVFVSGCFDLIHADHVEFLHQASRFGKALCVSVASDEVFMRHKHRPPSMPAEQKAEILKALRCVDMVGIGTGHVMGLDFHDFFTLMRPQILAVPCGDPYMAIKQELCDAYGCGLRTIPEGKRMSSTLIRETIKAPLTVPLRVDFAGGWLDVPAFARPGAYIVNCAIRPFVSFNDWPYNKVSGLGGSAAHALLCGRHAVGDELASGVGWQDPAVILETGLCVWQSGATPKLHQKTNGSMLTGLMGVYWTGKRTDASGEIAKQVVHNLTRIALAGRLAQLAVQNSCMALLNMAVMESYKIQLEEGMTELPALTDADSYKYCGAGFGGYALYIFSSPAARHKAVQMDGILPIEPYCE